MPAASGPARPPHCPNPGCDFHVDPAGWRYKRAGFFARQKAPFSVQRYRCTHCRRSFSQQTFSTTYWLKRPELQAQVLHGEVGGSGHRQMARQHDAAHSTIQRHVARIGRHCLLRHEALRARILERTGDEPLVLDGLRTFAGGQYWVLEISNLVGVRSYVSHDFVVTERRRSGTMTALQRRRRSDLEERLGRPDPRGLRKDVLELLDASLPEKRAVQIRSDDEKAYPWALGRLPGRPIHHETTPSTAPRTPHNPLFAVNAHHGFLRHSASNHKRETIAFSKKIASAIWRHAIFQSWVNEAKWASERNPTTTPAMRLRVHGRRFGVPDLLGRRLFPGRMRLRERLLAYYSGTVRSRFLANERVHELRDAF